MNHHHSQLLKSQLRHNQNGNPRKKRNRHTAEVLEAIIVEDNSSELSDDLEDVDLGVDKSNFGSDESLDAKEDSNQSAKGEEDDENDDFDDLEDVDLDQIFVKRDIQESETLTFNIHQKDEEPAKKNSRKFVPVPKAERQKRKLIHMLYLETMVAHGVVRNQWCNDKELQSELRKKLPSDIFSFLSLTNLNVLDYVKSRRFIEAIRKAAAFYHRKFRVSSQGLVRKDWETMLQRQVSTTGKVTLKRFRLLIKNFRGSRDIAAQGFVALLRSLGVTARLVFSLQPPDYRSIVPVGTINEKEKKSNKKKSKSSEFEPVFIPNLKQGFLMNARSNKEENTSEKKKYSFPISSYPIFWAEVWNKFSKKWITVDPIVLNVVEIMPMRRKCKFEPPATDSTNQTWYVIAYDNKRHVKDVTRRYTQYYNAKTVKKRIEFASDEDEHWYLQLLRGARPPRTIPTEAEILETKEFYDRDICEGVPNNMADFKNHPVYALESQLRQDEVIHPQDETSKCGTFKPMNKNTTLTVYKRSHVFRLRTAKAWHMRGRVLKIGVQPLKTKTVNRVPFDDDGDDDGIERLYAEFQTEIYRAPPIVDGKITKNAYGNLEIYTPTMMPDNGYLVKMTDDVTMKMLERAARDVLRIDYARAIVAFDFGGAKKNRTPTAREGGIVIDQQYQEAMQLVVDELQDMAEEEKRRQVELNALRSWKFFMKKLEIVNRLDRQHGKLEEGPELDRGKEEEGVEGAEGEEDGYFSVASEIESSAGEDNYVPRKRRKFIEEDDFEEGGFMLGEGGFSNQQTEFEGGMDEEGGFLGEIEEGGFLDEIEEGGFFAEVKREGGEGGFFSGERHEGLGEGGFVEDSEGGFLQEDSKENEGFLPESLKLESQVSFASDILHHGHIVSDSVPKGQTESPKSQSYGCKDVHETKFPDKSTTLYESEYSDQSASTPHLDRSEESNQFAIRNEALYSAEPLSSAEPLPSADRLYCAEPISSAESLADIVEAGRVTRGSPHSRKIRSEANRKDLPVVDVDSELLQPTMPTEIAQSAEYVQSGTIVVDDSSEEESVVEILDMSEIEKEEAELGLVYSDSE